MSDVKGERVIRRTRAESRVRQISQAVESIVRQIQQEGGTGKVTISVDIPIACGGWGEKDPSISVRRNVSETFTENGRKISK